MSKNKLPSQKILNRESVIDPEMKYVPHLMRYHAEIQYEGEIAMRYVCAAGETLDELAQDITKELRKVKHRLPQIVHLDYLIVSENLKKKQKLICGMKS